MIDMTIYLLASLPILERRGHPPFGLPEFRGTCHPLLARWQQEALDAAALFQRTPERPRLKVLRRWFAREHALRNGLVRLRAARQGIDAGPHLRPAAEDLDAERMAAEVIEIGSPRRAEDRLDDFRWDFLEELEFGCGQGLERLAVYSLKLQLLQRRAAFDEQAGRRWLEGRRRRVHDLTRYAIHKFGELDDD